MTIQEMNTLWRLAEHMKVAIESENPSSAHEIARAMVHLTEKWMAAKPKPLVTLAEFMPKSTPRDYTHGD